MIATPTPERFLKICKEVAKTVRLADKESAISGLTLTAMAFAAVLDNYAAPNEENPQGMCDDSAEFRQYFADIIVCTPSAIQSPEPQQEPTEGTQGGKENANR